MTRAPPPPNPGRDIAGEESGAGSSGSHAYPGPGRRDPPSRRESTDDLTVHSTSNKEKVLGKESLKAQSSGPPPSPTVSPYCTELPEDVVEKIAVLDLELSEGDITQKGYEKKKTKLLAPFHRENNPSKKTVEPEKNQAKAEVRTPAQSNCNGSLVSRISVPISSSQAFSQPSSSSCSIAAQAPSAPPAESTSSAFGLSDSSGQKRPRRPGPEELNIRPQILHPAASPSSMTVSQSQSDSKKHCKHSQESEDLREQKMFNDLIQDYSSIWTVITQLSGKLKQVTRDREMKAIEGEIASKFDQAQVILERMELDMASHSLQGRNNEKVNEKVDILLHTKDKNKRLQQKYNSCIIEAKQRIDRLENFMEDKMIYINKDLKQGYSTICAEITQLSGKLKQVTRNLELEEINRKKDSLYDDAQVILEHMELESHGLQGRNKEKVTMILDSYKAELQRLQQNYNSCKIEAKQRLDRLELFTGSDNVESDDLNTIENAYPGPPPSKRKKKMNVNPQKSKILTDSGSFKERNISSGGILNEDRVSCALNSVTFAIHRTGIGAHLVDINTVCDVTTGSEDKAMAAYRDILLALPNDKAISTKKFRTLWNQSSDTNDNRQKLGINDDILIFDSIVSEIKPYLDRNSPRPFFTEYKARFKCVFCNTKVTLDQYEKPFR